MSRGVEQGERDRQNENGNGKISFDNTGAISPGAVWRSGWLDILTMEKIDDPNTDWLIPMFVVSFVRVEVSFISSLEAATQRSSLA